MDQEQFQTTARELLERHITETNQPKQIAPEVGHEPEPTRPENHPGAGYASALGNYVSQTMVGLHNAAMINKEYHEHERSAQQNLEQHIEQPPEKAVPEQTDRISARDALLQHLEGAKSEVTDRKIDPFANDRARQSQGIEL